MYTVDAWIIFTTATMTKKMSVVCQYILHVHIHVAAVILWAERLIMISLTHANRLASQLEYQPERAAHCCWKLIVPC